jgi:hypothetical protein
MIKTFTGAANEYSNGWWAFCNQLPIAAHGETFNQALQGMIESIASYYAVLEGARPPKIRRLPEQDGALPFRVTVEVAV